MSYDPYNNSGYGGPSIHQGDPTSLAGGHHNPRQTKTQMPFAQDMGGRTPGVPSFVRAPYYPTAPFYSTDPNVGYQTRFYSTGILFNVDYTAATTNTEIIRNIQFDIPCRLIAMNGTAIPIAQIAAAPLLGLNSMQGVDPRDLFLFRVEYTTGDQITVNARLGSNTLGTNEGGQGELGGTGYTINAGGSLTVGITPLFQNMRIDITFVCLEMRGPSNYTRG